MKAIETVRERERQLDKVWQGSSGDKGTCNPENITGDARAFEVFRANNIVSVLEIADKLAACLPDIKAYAEYDPHQDISTIILERPNAPGSFDQLTVEISPAPEIKYANGKKCKIDRMTYNMDENTDELWVSQSTRCIALPLRATSNAMKMVADDFVREGTNALEQDRIIRHIENIDTSEPATPRDNGLSIPTPPSARGTAAVKCE